MLRTVVVENGVIEGLPAADPRITSFKGIPFAAPSIGENRWRAPQPAQNWEGVFPAYKYAPISLQAPTGVNKEDIYTREWAVDPEIPMGEDCLHLNVWTPACRVDEMLPVFVWYFGGGLQVGNTAEMEFDGERIARRGIVVVTVNYRLNVFGFLSHPDITAESPDAPTNFGHLDQKFGTEWVKRNIAAFGGDPENITIGGQSAGGASVMYMLTSPTTKGLFQRAIVESGIFTKVFPNHRAPTAPSLADAEQEGIKFFQLLGVSTLAEARKLDASFVLQKALDCKGHWGSITDGKLITGNFFEQYAQGHRWDMPVMMGHTSDEFHVDPNAATAEDFRQMAQTMFGSDAEEFMALCNGDSSIIDLMNRKASISGIEYAIRIVGQTNTDSSKATLYYYNFDAEIPGWDHPGTFHSVDLWFFFETLAKCWRPFVGKHYDLARQMCDYWANFIKTGNPNGKDSTAEELPKWMPYTAQAPYGMRFTDKAEFSQEQPSALMQFLVRQYFKRQ